VPEGQRRGRVAAKAGVSDGELEMSSDRGGQE